MRFKKIKIKSHKAPPLSKGPPTRAAIDFVKRNYRTRGERIENLTIYFRKVIRLYS